MGSLNSVGQVAQGELVVAQPANQLAPARGIDFGPELAKLSYGAICGAFIVVMGAEKGPI